MEDPALQEQLDYYRARAAEYDQWWLRQGRYDRGAEINASWFAESDEVRAALATFGPSGRVLELACGTGIWTEKLLPWAATLTALDGSPEMLALNAARLRDPRVRYFHADLFQWEPDERHDTVFFGFWLSHVPPGQFARFWAMLKKCLAPGGRVFFVDSQRDPGSTALNHQLPAPGDITHRRRLDDGREFLVYKVFHDPATLTAQLAALGWRCELQRTEHYFLHGHAEPIV